jgi:hypothetical protein
MHPPHFVSRLILAFRLRKAPLRIINVLVRITCPKPSCSNIVTGVPIIARSYEHARLIAMRVPRWDVLPESEADEIFARNHAAMEQMRATLRSHFFPGAGSPLAHSIN